RRGEDDAPVLRADGRLGVVAGLGRELLGDAAVEVRLEDVVARVQGPDVTLAVIGLGRAGVAAEVRRRVDDLLIAGQEIGARRRALARRHALRLGQRAIDAHGVDLIAALAGVRLEDELVARARPVRLGVFAPVGELKQLAEVGLARVAQARLPVGDGRRRRRRRRRGAG